MRTQQGAPPAQPGDARTGDDLSQLLSAVREAGALALSYFGKDPRTEIKPDGTSVSEADYAADALLKERLAGAGQRYGWLSEESEDDLVRLEQARIWVVDPIDGTRAFLQNKPQWTISAALVENGRSILGAVYNPATDEFFHARRGGGAYLNDKPITVNNPVALDGCYLAAAKSTFKPDRWSEPWPRMDTIWVNSIAYRLALVAAGMCDGTVSLSNKSDWDIAAAHLLIDEAGGLVTTHDARMLVYNLETPRHTSIVAAGPELHAGLIERMEHAAI